MRVYLYLPILIISTIAHIAEARTYLPLGSEQVLSTSNQLLFRSTKLEDRPILPGMRPVQLELLEDALRRKMPRKVGSSSIKAHDSIIRNSLRNPVKRSHMRGILAEALYLKDNPTWGYVKSPTASQHDVYTWLDGRRAPYTAQIKTHVSGNPYTYAQDMVSDHRSIRFIVPDDHVEPLRDYWRLEINKSELDGRAVDATEAKRQYARIEGLGYTSKGLDSQLNHSAKYALRERQATYVSLGAGLAMSIGPTLYDWLQTGTINKLSPEQTAHAGALIASERATTYALGKIGSGAMRGSFRGNAITGMAILATDTSFSIYEQGGTRAFKSVGFFTQLGGGIGALTIGMSTGTLVTSMISPINPLAGAFAGFITGTTTGFVGYIFGQSATRRILEVSNPDFFHKAEDLAIRNADNKISSKISKVKNTQMSQF